MFNELRDLVSQLEDLTNEQLRVHRNCVRQRQLLQQIKVASLRLRKQINDRRKELMVNP